MEERPLKQPAEELTSDNQCYTFIWICNVNLQYSFSGRSTMDRPSLFCRCWSCWVLQNGDQSWPSVGLINFESIQFYAVRQLLLFILICLTFGIFVYFFLLFICFIFLNNNNNNKRRKLNETQFLLNERNELIICIFISYLS